MSVKANKLGPSLLSLIVARLLTRFFITPLYILSALPVFFVAVVFGQIGTNYLSLTVDYLGGTPNSSGAFDEFDLGVAYFNLFLIISVLGEFIRILRGQLKNESTTVRWIKVRWFVSLLASVVTGTILTIRAEQHEYAAAFFVVFTCLVGAGYYIELSVRAMIGIFIVSLAGVEHMGEAELKALGINPPRRSK